MLEEHDFRHERFSCHLLPAFWLCDSQAWKRPGSAQSWSRHSLGCWESPCWRWSMEDSSSSQVLLSFALLCVLGKRGSQHPHLVLFAAPNLWPAISQWYILPLPLSFITLWKHLCCLLCLIHIWLQTSEELQWFNMDINIRTQLCCSRWLSDSTLLSPYLFLILIGSYRLLSYFQSVCLCSFFFEFLIFLFILINFIIWIWIYEFRF